MSASSLELRKLEEVDWKSLRRETFHPSPANWQDQLLYFLLLDRYSDGKEFGGFKSMDDRPVVRTAKRTTPVFCFEQDAYRADRAAWAAAGGNWCGGTLSGLKDKLGYIKRLGVTGIWISPVLKQVEFQASYHGYATQDFLDVDSHFGTREDLRALVDEAHSQGLYVILDILLNHSGDVFAYAEPGRGGDHPWDGGSYPAAGLRNAFGQPVLPFPAPGSTASKWRNDAIWPMEFQEASTFSCRGGIRNWDYDPEHREGDFCGLKNIEHGHHQWKDGHRVEDVFTPSPALTRLCDVYRYWMTYADLDGFRMDAVKHMEPGAVRLFANVMHEAAQELGKENFLLLAEIAGGRQFAVDLMESTGVDAALGLAEVQPNLEYLAKGWRNPDSYFGLFRNSLQERKESHVWFGRHVVTMFDDHDKIWQGTNKSRFAGDKINNSHAYLKTALALNMLSLGIPCIYYGTEQGFDGAGDNDRFLRECMFGGDFGSLQSTGRHFFNEDHELYRFVASLAAVVRGHTGLRRGRQYLRPISQAGQDGSPVGFGEPRFLGGRMTCLLPWSRLWNRNEYLAVLNLDETQAQDAWITVDSGLCPPGTRMTQLFSTDPAAPTTLDVADWNGASVRLALAPMGVAVYRN